MRGVVVAILLGVLFGVMELAARFYVTHGSKISDRDFSRYYRFDLALRLLTWGDRYSRHPYFGYVNLERLDELERLHANLNDSEYVIAILGGSVADQFATYVIKHSQYCQDLSKTIPEIGDRAIRIVDLAFCCYKQPPQFLFASYLLEKFDLTINIDGINESIARDLGPVYPTDLPHLTLRL